MNERIVFGEFVVTLLLATVGCLSVSACVFQVLTRNPDFAARLTAENRRTRFLVRRAADGVFGVFLLTYVAIFSWLMILKHQTFRTGYDFAIFDQVVWNSLHGRLLETSITPLSSSWLGTHFAPILLALVPLYAIWTDPQILLIFQTLALAFTAFPLYWVARERLGRLLALTVTFAFFLFPALEYVNFAEFHEIALATPLLTLAVYFLLRRRWTPFLISLLLTLLLREEVAFIVIAVGVFVLFQGKPRLGLGLVVFGLLWAVALFQYIIPYFSATKSYVVTGFHYALFGNSPTEVVHSIFSKPDLVLRTIFAPAKIEFVLHLLVPLALLPLLGLEVTVLALPTLGYLLLAGEAQASIRFQYPAPIIPFLFLGAVLGLQRILKWSVSSRAWCWGKQPDEIRLLTVKAALAALLLVASLMGYYLYAPGPLARNFNPALFMAESERDTLARTLMERVPSDAALLTHGGLTPHLSHRTRIYYLPFVNDFRQVEYLLIDLARCGWCKEGVASMLASGYFETLFDQSGFLLARRRPLERSLQIQFDDQVSLIGYSIVTTDTLRGGQTLRPVLGWRAEQSLTKSYEIWVHLLDQRGHLWAQDEREPQEGNLPTNRWTPGQFVGDQYTLSLPIVMPPGDYRIAVAVFDPASNRHLIARDATGRVLGETVVLETVRIEKNKASVTASDLQKQFQLEHPFFVDMQEIRLIGFKPIPRTIAAGQTLPIGVYWRAREKPRGDYLVSVQLLDTSGRVVLEHKDRPAAGAYPTTEWDAGEVLLDWHDLVLPSEMRAGEYSVRVVLKDIASGTILGEATLAQILVKP